MNIKTNRITQNGKTFAEYELVFEPQQNLFNEVSNDK